MAAAVRSISTSGRRLVRTIAAPAAASVISTAHADQHVDPDQPVDRQVDARSGSARRADVPASSSRTISIRQRYLPFRRADGEGLSVGVR